MATGTIILIVGGVLAFILLIVGLLISSRDERSLVKDRLGYLEEIEMMPTAGEGEKGAPMTDWLNNQAGRFSWGQKLARELARADMKFRVGEYIALRVITTIAGAGLGWFFSGRGALAASIPGMVIGGGIGYMLPKIYVSQEKGKRLVKFDGQLADMLNLMVNGLRAGYSTMQAMEAVSREMPEPIAGEFHRVVQEMQIGITMEAALDNLVRRIPSLDLDLVVTAMNVQREVGGNLAEILDTISHTIRERVRVKGEIHVLTTQARFSGQFLSVLPVLVIVAMYFLNRSYMMKFFEEDTRMIGIPLLIVGAVMIGFGYFVMMKIADIEL